jgi:hypothetical protein
LYKSDSCSVRNKTAYQGDRGQSPEKVKERKMRKVQGPYSASQPGVAVQAGGPVVGGHRLHEIFQTPRIALLSLIPQESPGFFTLSLQGLTRILLEQFHFLPSYKSLLNLQTPE